MTPWQIFVIGVGVRWYLDKRAERRQLELLEEHERLEAQEKALADRRAAEARSVTDVAGNRVNFALSPATSSWASMPGVPLPSPKHPLDSSNPWLAGNPDGSPAGFDPSNSSYDCPSVTRYPPPGASMAPTAEPSNPGVANTRTRSPMILGEDLDQRFSANQQQAAYYYQQQQEAAYSQQQQAAYYQQQQKQQRQGQFAPSSAGSGPFSPEMYSQAPAVYSPGSAGGTFDPDSRRGVPFRQGAYMHQQQQEQQRPYSPQGAGPRPDSYASQAESSLGSGPPSSTGHPLERDRIAPPRRFPTGAP
jgi:hypothetical protein